MLFRTSSSLAMCIDDANAPSAFLLVTLSAVSFSSFSFLRNVGFGDTERIVLVINISLHSDAICFIFLRFRRTLANNFISAFREDKNASLKRRPEDDDDDDDDISTPFVRRFFGEDRPARTKKGEKKEE